MNFKKNIYHGIDFTALIQLDTEARISVQETCSYSFANLIGAGDLLKIGRGG